MRANRNEFSTAVEFVYTVSDIFDLAIREFWKNRKRQRFICGFLAFRKVAFFVSQLAEAFLHVEWQWIIHCRADILFCEELLEFIALLSPDDILVKYMPILQARRGV